MDNQPKTIKPCCQLDNDTTTCNQKTKVYSRVVGYIRPVEDWNPAKHQEFDDRKTYATPQSDKTSSSKTTAD